MNADDRATTPAQGSTTGGTAAAPQRSAFRPVAPSPTAAPSTGATSQVSNPPTGSTPTRASAFSAPARTAAAPTPAAGTPARGPIPQPVSFTTTGMSSSSTNLLIALSAPAK